MNTHSSLFKWGGLIHFPEKTEEISDYWPDEMRSNHIMVLEAKALLNVLSTVKERIKHHRIYALIDSQPLLNSWNNQGSKNSNQNCNFVCVGDSMNRFFFGRRQFSNSVTHIFLKVVPC